MRHNPHRNAQDEQGMLLLGALFLSTLTMLLISVSLTRTFTEMRAATLNMSQAQTFHLAEGEIDFQLRQLMSRFTDKNGFLPDPELTAIQKYTVSGYKVNPGVADQPVYTAPQSTMTITDPLIQLHPRFRPFRGMQAQRRPVQLTADVTSTATMTRTRLSFVADLYVIPIFQFAMWDHDDLWIGPTPFMNITGAIYANGNLYINPVARVDINGMVSAVGDILHPSTGKNGDIRFADPSVTYVSMKNPDGTWLQSTSANWATESQTRWGGRVQAHAQPIELPLPLDASNNPINPIELIKPGQPLDTPAMHNARFYYRAGLRIVNGNTVDSNGTILSVLPPDVITTANFYDDRENKPMCVTELDIAKLQQHNLAPANGILYIESNYVGCKNGVRIKNGSQLPAGGLTVATHNPIYVKGDYNTLSKQPASLLADAITVLSANWIDQQPPQASAINTRVASSGTTTLNAAVMAGRVRDSSSEYIIRYLEDWHGKTFAFTGSDVSPWESAEAGTDLACCDVVYNPPTRIWTFDSSFLTGPNALPPGTPSILTETSAFWKDCALNAPSGTCQ